MADSIRLLSDLGPAVKRARVGRRLSPMEKAKRSGRSRATLYRLEGGEDVSVSVLLDILRSTGHALAIVPAGMPTLEEIQERFGQEDDD